MATAHGLFLATWDEAPHIAFCPEWNNGTGYMNPATTITVSRVVGFFDEESKRRGILVPCAKGSLVVFERYSDGRDGVLVSNSPCLPTIFTGALSVEAMDLVSSLITDRTYTRSGVESCCMHYFDAGAAAENMVRALDNAGFTEKR